MGYRTHLGSIPKKEYNKIKSLTKKELFDFYGLKSDDGEEPHKGVWEFGKEIHGFGSNNNFIPPKKTTLLFFKKACTKEIYSEKDFVVVNKDFLKYIIEYYRKKVADHYNNMVTPFFGAKNDVYVRDKHSDFLNSIKVQYGLTDNISFDFSKITQEEQDALFEMFEHIKSMRNEWSCLTPFDLDNNAESITTSWKFEYNVFELVRIYKTFDWKRNVMFYYGY